MGFEPATSVFERAKTVHALDRAATVISMKFAFTILILHYHLHLDIPCDLFHLEFTIIILYASNFILYYNSDCKISIPFF
jgi:hypothetical protein